MTTTEERPHLWQVIWAALDSNNPGDVCSSLIDTYTDLAADAVLKHFDGEVEHLRAKLATVAEHRDEKQAEIDRLRSWVDRFRQGMNTAVKERDLLRAQRDELLASAKPNPWFTPAEFPVEEAERADRERASISYAFPTQEWREEQLKVRDRKAEALQQHHETVAHIVEAVAMGKADPDFRQYLLAKRREDCRVDIAFGGQLDDERTVRTEAAS